MLERYKKALENRQEKGIYRRLQPRGQGVDFLSNDYLGLSKSLEFQNRISEIGKDQPHLFMGATGARLISGTTQLMMDVEKRIANWHGTEGALVFESGYMANLALFSSLPQKGDVVFVDAHIHRSVHDGCRLSFAQKKKFKHNDLLDLEVLLQKSEVQGSLFIAVESVYSMDGDFAPLQELILLAEKYHAHLIVDEAHAFGVFGWGRLHQEGLQNRVFATVATYGKGMGLQGASILASDLVIQYLINFASEFGRPQLATPFSSLIKTFPFP